MKVLPIIPRGYCKGVVGAIKIANEYTNYNKPVSILGMIVHNQYIVDALEQNGIQTIDKKGASRIELLDSIEEGVVIITAHGASDEVFIKAKQKGLEVVDATCKDVVKTHQLVKDYLKKDFHILYIGKHGHPESQGVLSIDTQKIHLIEKKEDYDSLDPTLNYVLTNQTTMSIYDVYRLCNYAKEHFDHIIIEQEVCNATTIRQQAIASLEDEVDVLFIVGDRASHNSQKLASIAKEQKNIDVYLIDHVQQIELTHLHEKKYAAVSSGASTPTYLTNQVIEFLKQYDHHDLKTHIKPEIDITKIL